MVGFGHSAEASGGFWGNVSSLVMEMPSVINEVAFSDHAACLSNSEAIHDTDDALHGSC
jgi:hypothetical protein